MRSIRGAVTVAQNTKEDILKETELLLKDMLAANNLYVEDIISIIFTCTGDLDQAYPAVAARNLGITSAALMCFQELHVENSLQQCIRVMINADIQTEQSHVKHIYLKGAKILRPDLADDKS